MIQALQELCGLWLLLNVRTLQIYIQHKTANVPQKSAYSNLILILPPNSGGKFKYL